MEVLFRLLGALHLIYGWLLFGAVANALKEDSSIELSRAQWGIKTLLLLAEIVLLTICGLAALLLEPSAYIYAFLSIVILFLVVFSDTVALRGLSALAGISTPFYLHALIRGVAAVTLLATGRYVSGA
ncbi:hypothetical protein QFW80_01285 [Luteimonas sp. M1R5S18]|uniref:DUF2269 family protein n=1 Tax=Luteimonas rhizosphaericola TaxID=3042024 RepID=A0ABT6JF02_9GAMM|nr:hypothetical protein [Luteimonas rhizosphaericola]MDH5829152.1 hypothetical protein [Luteimonas rhizosphaericola]